MRPCGSPLDRVVFTHTHAHTHTHTHTHTEKNGPCTQTALFSFKQRGGPPKDVDTESNSCAVYAPALRCWVASSARSHICMNGILIQPGSSPRRGRIINSWNPHAFRIPPADMHKNSRLGLELHTVHAAYRVQTESGIPGGGSEISWPPGEENPTEEHFAGLITSELESTYA